MESGTTKNSLRVSQWDSSGFNCTRSAYTEVLPWNREQRRTASGSASGTLPDLSAPDPLTRRFFRGIGNSEEQPPGQPVGLFRISDVGWVNTQWVDSTAISFLTENENLMKQPPDATSSSDSDPDLSLSPRPQTYGLRLSGGSIPRTLISPPTSI
ncbi:hypothetical protein AVEN_57869-1 [Araneus ventricosus]|uniref:Uncharacterized protein n=1 Tax=Araneus ventricosus TaxID=182803 RepID=A0A4Y2X307_ARAVE|nr:hypothetical protein AVEN_57869-1 [Araneus ventricosus]